MYLLTEWEGRTGKYLARGQNVRTERSEVSVSWPRSKYFPVRLDLQYVFYCDFIFLKNFKF